MESVPWCLIDDECLLYIQSYGPNLMNLKESEDLDRSANVNWVLGEVISLRHWES